MPSVLKKYTYVLIIFLICGCNDSRQLNLEHSQADTEGLKISDIASPGTKITDNLMIKNICIDCDQYEIPLENFNLLSDIWPILSNQALSFNSQKAFLANSFVLGFGNIEIWDDINQKLRLAGAKKIMTTTMLFSPEQEFDIQGTSLKKLTSLSYIDESFALQKTDASKGILNLRIKARKPANSKGICHLYGKIVHIPPKKHTIESPNIISPEFEFKETGFGAKMKQGDFLVLTPGLYIGDEKSLTHAFFYKNTKKPCFKLYILFCTGIID